MASMRKQKQQTSNSLSLSYAMLSTLLGRDQEVQEGQQLLQHPDVRLLTLTGIGGVGKTRLGLAIVEKASSSFSDGVLAISLASLHHPDLLVPTLLQKLSAREERERSLLATLLAFLRTKHLLLFLDNFEQVVAGASLLVRLLEHCPDLKILVTSREMLRVRSEHILQVQPLPLPNLTVRASAEELGHNPAMQLFAQRVQSMQPAFAMTEENIHIIAEICIGGVYAWRMLPLFEIN
jgi:predicted ATPase